MSVTVALEVDTFGDDNTADVTGDQVSVALLVCFQAQPVSYCQVAFGRMFGGKLVTDVCLVPSLLQQLDDHAVFLVQAALLDDLFQKRVVPDVVCVSSRNCFFLSMSFTLY